MDITRALLEALDDPSAVWESVMANLADSPRTALMSLTTLPTPCALDEWQNAVAGVSPESALKFESSLKVLDDTFIRTYRSWPSTYKVDYRNPSIEDFCTKYLDDHVGFLTIVISKDLTLSQVGRLYALARAWRYGKDRRARYPAIQRFVMANGNRLLTIVVDHVVAMKSPEQAAKGLALLLNMYDYFERPPDRRKHVRKAFAKAHTAWKLGESQSALRTVLRDTNSSATRFLADLWSPTDIVLIRDALVDLVRDLDDCQLLMDFEVALGAIPVTKDWSDDFAAVASAFANSCEEYTETAELESDLERLESIASYLDSNIDAEREQIQDWLDQLQKKAEEAESNSEDRDDDIATDDDETPSEIAAIDDLFESLLER